MGLTVWGGVGGSNALWPREVDKERVVAFLDLCAETGVTRLIPAHQPKSEICIRYDHGDGAFDPQDVLATIPPFQDVHGWDPLAFLVAEAHERDIEVHPYNAVGYAGMVGVDYQTGAPTADVRISRFGNDHPECWMRRQDGQTSFDVCGSVILSYGYPEARRYEHRHFLEMARQYNVDGVQLEFEIVSTPYQMDAHGVSVYGYEEPIVDSYRTEIGRDPFEIPNHDEHWARFRAGYVTQFVRELRVELQMIRDVKLTAAVAANPARAYKRMQDWPVWVDEGLVDEIHIRHLTGHIGHIFEDTLAAVCSVNGRVPVVAQLTCFGRERLTTPDSLKDGAAAALAAGADQIGIYRADRMCDLHLWDAARSIAQGAVDESRWITSGA